MSLLGRDFGALALERFGGRLQLATLTRVVGSGYDIDNPAAGTIKGAPSSYTCDAIAFNYKQTSVKNDQIIHGDYRVTIVRLSWLHSARAGSRDVACTTCSAAAGDGCVDGGGAQLVIVPVEADKISVPPPGKTTAIEATVINVESVTDALITIQVRGVPA